MGISGRVQISLVVGASELLDRNSHRNLPLRTYVDRRAIGLLANLFTNLGKLVGRLYLITVIEQVFTNLGRNLDFCRE